MRDSHEPGASVPRRFVLVALLGLAVLVLSFPSCDKLITEVNNITVYDTTIGKECQKCHTDKDDKLIVIPKGQWANSKHSSPDLLERPILLNGKLQTATTCGTACHSGNGYVDSILTGHPASVDTIQPSVINCFTCHLPHSIPNDASSLDSLRGVSAAVPLTNSANFIAGKSTMCANCHRATGAPPAGFSDVVLTSSFGPHFGAQADVYNGTGGARFENVSTPGSHPPGGSFNGCINCHFGEGRGYDFGEHTFRLQYHDAAHDTTPYTPNCTRPGCHASTIITDFYEISSNASSLVLRDSIVLLSDSLKDFLLYAGVLDPADSTGRMILTGEKVTWQLAKIAYNYLLYTHDGSRGLHNPQLIRKLLRDSYDRIDSLPPLANFSANPDNGCAPLTVQFTDLSKFKVDSVFWNFGDAQTDTTHNPSHFYASGGNYTVKLKVFGPGGIDSLVQNGLILARAQVKAKIGYATRDTLPDTIGTCINSPVAFLDSSTGGVTARVWTFLDSNLTDTTRNVTRRWTQPGKYVVPVKLLVSNDCTPLGDSLLDTVTVIVDSPVVAEFTILPNDTVIVNDTVFFTDQSQNARSWHWLFGFSGDTSIVQSPLYVPRNAGAYVVKLTATNHCGSSSIEHTVWVLPSPAPPIRPPIKEPIR
jgi:PKD repeat protein